MEGPTTRELAPLRINSATKLDLTVPCNSLSLIRLVFRRRRIFDISCHFEPTKDGDTTSRCMLQCCATHDECYFKNGCTSDSWLHPIKNGWKCERGNVGVSICFARCNWNPTPWPNRPYWFCAAAGRPIGICPPDPKTGKAHCTCPNVEAAQFECRRPGQQGAKPPANKCDFTIPWDRQQQQ